jgi:hypothetical protein
VKPVVAKTFPLDQAAEAQRFIEEEHPAGKVVLTASDGPQCIAPGASERYNFRADGPAHLMAYETFADITQVFRDLSTKSTLAVVSTPLCVT